MELIIVVVILIVAIVYSIDKKKKSDNYIKARNDVMMIVDMIEQYRETYNKYPIIEKGIDEQPGGPIIEILTAVRTSSGQPFYEDGVKLNPKMINFAKPFIGRRTVNNMIVDPWDNPYNIAIDTNDDGIVEFNHKTYTHDNTLIDELFLKIHKPVIAWSNGPDGRNDNGFGDDICSWQI